MIGTFVLISAWMLNSGQCMELNSLEISPFYDAIIFGDIAEIINDMDTNMNFQTDKKQTSENESDEEIENLLSEYQHYLEKAEKQRLKYFEKSNLKNKVPLLRHERFTKLNFPKTQSNNRKPSLYTSNIQLSQRVYRHPYDLLNPMQSTLGDTLPPFNKLILKENKMNDFMSNTHKTGSDVILPSCFCEENKFPCTCNCKQCFIPLEKKTGTYFEPFKTSFKDNALLTSSSSYKNIGYYNEKADDKSESDINIRVKFDIQLPNINDVLKKIFKSLNRNKTAGVENTDVNDNLTPINISTPDISFPIPVSIFTYGVSRLHNYDYPELHKITSHKKKKFHTNYPSKKHRGKFFTLHHGKVTASQNLLTPEVYKNDSYNLNNLTKDTETNIKPNATKELEPSAGVNISDVNSVDQGYIFNMPTFVNISNDDNIVEVDTTTEKIINTFYTILEQTNATDSPQYFRVKREDKFIIIDNGTVLNNDLLKVKGINSAPESQNGHESSKKVDNKLQLSDSDLLYWPNKSQNNTDGSQNSPLNYTVNNTGYTTILNASWHKALSKINWTDIDIAASTFSSLMGKHLDGILSFCSENRCRSVKCTDKLCVHRICSPEERYNQRGHCSLAANETDSTISMESSLDVSFDIACELVETLQNQLLGYTYGKATICINIKCITLVANKKSFTKTKCSKKQLNLEGHCQSLKNAKIV